MIEKCLKQQKEKTKYISKVLEENAKKKEEEEKKMLVESQNIFSFQQKPLFENQIPIGKKTPQSK